MESSLLSPLLEPNSPANNSVPSNEQRDRKSIYKVPDYITTLCPKAYQPQVVSFGPYHHKDKRLSPMEDHKCRARVQFEKRSGQSLELLIQSLRSVEHELKDSYDELDSVWQESPEDEFLKVMVTDGCFMLEIMSTTTGGNLIPRHAENDPIFSAHWLSYITPYIRRDMLLLENQLPMLVLYHLVAIVNDRAPNECIEVTNELILRFYDMPVVSPRQCRIQCTDFTPTTQPNECIEVTNELILERLHVMDVFRKGLLTDPQIVQHEPNSCVRTILKFCFLDKCIRGIRRCLWHVADVSKKIRLMETENVPHEETEKIIRSATELSKTGIQFKNSPTHCLKGISFAGGVLKLPVITVDGSAESKFLNLITFERLHGTGNEITSYISFMDNIINNEQDVALLHAQGIIQNAIGSDKAVAKLFNSLCKEVTVGSSEMIDPVQKKIGEYYKDPSNSCWATFNDTYFSSPWARLSLYAAVILFVLTIIQTIYAVLSYY